MPVIEVVRGQVFVVDVEPPPQERVYIYDEGFPPGVYLYGGFYYYGGYRYHRDIFIDRYVSINIRERRFIDVERNRRLGHEIEERHRAEFVKYGPRHDARPRQMEKEPPRPTQPPVKKKPKKEPERY